MFYRDEMTRHSWKELDPQGTDWQSANRHTHVLGVYKQSNYTLVIERLEVPDAEPDKRTYRLLLTTL